MANRKKKKGQLSLKLGINDERIPKLIGILCLFFGLYLLIAFISYIFTWSIDQDKVFRFSWAQVLRSEIDMANWLGRLGAIVSHTFFFWGFGLSSFIFVYLLGKLGFWLIQRKPILKFLPILNKSVLILLLSSMILEFFIGKFSEFPWGGAFGEGISQWMTSFVGTIGLIVLFIFAIAGFLMWQLNPNFNDLTPGGFFEDLKAYIRNGFSTNKKTLEDIDAIRAIDKPTGLRPGDRGEDENDLSEDAEPEKPKEGVTASQLALKLVGLQKKQPESLKVGEGELEIQSGEDDIDLENTEEDNAPPSLSVLAENKDHTEPYDPTLELSMYEFPSVQLLDDYSDKKVEIDRAELENNKDQIIETLLNYKIEIIKIRATIGPTVTLYEIIPAPGVRISRIKNLEDDIALSLSALGIRIIAPIPGKGTIGIEVPNKKQQIVSMREVLHSEKFRHAKMDLPIALGKTISNEVLVADLAKMPHLLVAGATGQGKSVGINAILLSLLYKKHPSQIKFVLIDPKKVELFPYSKLLEHFLAYLPDQEEPITTETNMVIHTLNSLCIEMDQRYELLKTASVRHIREYNEKFVSRKLNPAKGHKFLPFIILVIDEFADLIMTAGKEIELPIGRLAQLARAVGIHLVIATQRPSVNIITGVIKANFPARIAYKVTAKVDSRTILDAGGADQLIGRGDMLLSVGGEMVRLQGAFVDTPEVERVIDFIAKQTGYPHPHYLPEFHGDDEIGGISSLKYVDLDPSFEDAARLVVQNQHGSTSMIQRRLKLGYNRAGRIMDQLEAIGIVGPSEGSKAREVLMYDERELDSFLEMFKNQK
ncbi:MAG: DNA translocase FtsK 4TM domain-containing protein [Saprospiraceae bacterium]|nr:DNA translocase FtsK 4TM domain-containing protein [Saprospiraceae bacterium]MCB9324866.1 DNA translocase FtsK 4TM domain-containing protein [Lewinellaceae bacterium]